MHFGIAAEIANCCATFNASENGISVLFRTQTFSVGYRKKCLFRLISARRLLKRTLVTSGAEQRFASGWSLMGRFDGELASRAQTYSGTGRLSYVW